jgi:hypothetical protein
VNVNPNHTFAYTELYLEVHELNVKAAAPPISAATMQWLDLKDASNTDELDSLLDLLS